jgi:hypothetical protein
VTVTRTTVTVTAGLWSNSPVRRGAAGPKLRRGTGQTQIHCTPAAAAQGDSSTRCRGRLPAGRAVTALSRAFDSDRAVCDQYLVHGFATAPIMSKCPSGLGYLEQLHAACPQTLMSDVMPDRPARAGTSTHFWPPREGRACPCLQNSAGGFYS